MGTKYHDDSTIASDSIAIALDLKKLNFLMPELLNPIQRLKYKLRRWGIASYIERIEEHIKLGDSQGAIVVATYPLLIAAYNEDIDCVVMLMFEQKIQNKYNFKIKDRLICVNTFGDAPELQSDLIPGKDNFGMWTVVHPIIANLVSNSNTTIEKRKKEIGDDGYDYIWKLAQEYRILKKGNYRNGKPFYAAQANSNIEGIHLTI